MSHGIPNLPKDASTMRRMGFLLHAYSLRYFLEALFRLLPPESVTVVALNDEERRVTCYLSDSEFAMLKHWLRDFMKPEERRTEEDEIEEFRVFLEHIDEEEL